MAEDGKSGADLSQNSSVCPLCLCSQICHHAVVDILGYEYRGRQQRTMPLKRAGLCVSFVETCFALGEAMSTGVPYIGSKISLITTSDIRYEGPRA